MTRIAAIQMVSTPDVQRNLADAAELLAHAAGQGATVAGLPEYFCLMGRRDEDKLTHAEPPGRGPIQDFLREQAQRHGLWLIAGTIPVASPEPGRVYNRSLLLSPQGEVVAHYDKVHLFRFNNGREAYDEARVLKEGAQPVAATVGTQPALRVGLSVCYDLRFPELFRALSFGQPNQAPCDLMAVPSAFTHTTGQAHWEVLLRARAIENQCYVMAPAQGGLHENGRRTWGHSLVIDPWGEVLACVDEGPGVAVADVDLKRLADVRQQLPALQHRRLGSAPAQAC
ncbi:MAG: carbon-nitrogen hydrolase family protein [Burkholderiales bacterium]|nr:carbon-nitrogen hydrolase family protein [Burkholderiales bacterium]